MGTFTSSANSDEVMSAIKLALKDITRIQHGVSYEAGWWEGVDHLDPNVKAAKMCLMHSEISEAMEGMRKDLMDDKLPHRKMEEVELVDVLLRIFDYAGRYDLDLGGALVEKMRFNITRPDHKKVNRDKEGGKKI